MNNHHIDRLVKTLGNDFPATALVWVWISCTHSCLNCLSRCVRMVYKHSWLRHSSCCRKVPLLCQMFVFWVRDFKFWLLVYFLIFFNCAKFQKDWTTFILDILQGSHWSPLWIFGTSQKRKNIKKFGTTIIFPEGF